MTLNTFHLAGHGGANVTLGIPRLREILMTATDKIKTPSMTLTFNDESLSKELAEKHCRKLQRVIMLELINNVEIHEKNKLSKKGTILGYEERARIYKLIITFEEIEAIKYGFGIDESMIKFVKFVIFS
jgi:DNA-directed RNA polymerase I subunit RPA1